MAPSAIARPTGIECTRAAVVVVRAVDLDGREEPGDGTAGCHRWPDRPGGEPARRRALDLGGHALEGHLQVLDALDPEVLGDEVADQATAHDVRAVPGEARGLPHRALAHLAGPDDVAPQLLEPRDPVDARVRRDEGPVDRADARPDDEVGGDALGEQRLQHAHPGRSEDAAAAEDEGGGGHGRQITSAGRQRAGPTRRGGSRPRRP
uniref:Uncharacterized protein n=1 Tax=Janibacter limosus TaxID=53458 RepID=A0AC61U4M1_9MICO|nr:hypothetical protein [Janibacter limosus]